MERPPLSVSTLIRIIMAPPLFQREPKKNNLQSFSQYQSFDRKYTSNGAKLFGIFGVYVRYIFLRICPTFELHSGGIYSETNASSLKQATVVILNSLVWSITISRSNSHGLLQMKYTAIHLRLTYITRYAIPISLCLPFRVERNNKRSRIL